MTGPEVRMPTGAVARHGNSLDAAADAVSTAHGAAAQVHTDQESYGKLMAGLLPMLLNALSGSGVRSLEQAVTTLRETADKLRTAAAGAESTDQASAVRSTAVAPRRELPL